MGGGKIVPESSGQAKEWNIMLMNSHTELYQTFMSCCCPCITHGLICAKEGWGSFIVGCLVYTTCYMCGVSILSLNTWRREQLRRSRNIKGNIADDILAASLCETCALVQEYREVEPQDQMSA
ncbi:hypothetical protein BC829DRAFT_399976 [Chytridium lagenaria]|nr:hypothetical protein BC829DRAFT_399976 [Chytridium lagenaria]